MNDYSTFSLRVFERSFVARSLAHFQIAGGVASSARGNQREIDGYLRQFLAGDWERGFGNGVIIVWACILAEAGEWIRAGRKIGYFSQKSLTTPLVAGGIDFLESEEFFHFLSAQFGFWRDPDLSDGEEFADSLVLATLDITPERIEYLRLVYFASSSDWWVRFSEVQALAGLVARRPDVSISNVAMDRMAWAFYGTDAMTELHPGPALWRRLLADPVENNEREWGSERREELAGELSTLRGAMEEMLDLDSPIRRPGLLTGPETSSGVRRHESKTLEDWIRFGTTAVRQPPESFDIW